MALILHLTDLHLGEGAEQQIGDNKTGIHVEMPKRDDIYKETLKKISKHLIDTNQKLDSVIISGDITKYNREDGFKMLDSVLNELGDKKPNNNKIIILPGNHDVTWGEENRDEKYKHFIKYIRGKGYITPYLDECEDPTNTLKCDILNIDDYNIQIVPINTSNYCGTSRSLKSVNSSEETKIKNAVLSVEKGRAFWEELEKIRLHDISRVSKKQFIHLQKIIEEKTTKKEGLLRIAVTHHHIAPVSTYEEFKTFESVTNVGDLSNFLREYNFSAILHGHKHKQSVHWKLLPDYSKTFNDYEDEKPILIVSGATLPENTHDKDDIIRLIKINNNNQSQTIEIIPIGGADVSGGYRPATSKVYTVNSNPLNTSTTKATTLVDLNESTNSTSNDLPKVKNLSTTDNTNNFIITISGNDVDETYDKVLEHFKKQDDNKLISHVICELKNAPDLYTLPSSYDFGKDDANKMKERVQEWVDWWGQPKTNLEGYKYTHGQRVFSYKHIDQIIDRVVPILSNNIDKDKPTSRGCVSLYNPEEDNLTNENVEFPHFMSMQFIINTRNNQKYLDCIAYFRKQEMRYWWPINIAEITNFLNIITEKVNTKRKDKILKSGSITTISALAYTGKKHAIPAFAIPKIDILYDEYRSSYSTDSTDLKKNHLWKLIYSLFHQVPNSIVFRNEWNSILDELVPRELRDQNAVSIAVSGIEYTINQIGLYSEFQPYENIFKFKRELELLLESNKSYIEKTKEANERDYIKWRKKCSDSVHELKKHLNNIFNNLEPKV